MKTLETICVFEGFNYYWGRAHPPELIPLAAYCKTWSKAGYSWAWGLTMLIPLANIIGFCVLGFSKWPIEEELEQIKANAGINRTNF